MTSVNSQDSDPTSEAGTGGWLGPATPSICWINGSTGWTVSVTGAVAVGGLAAGGVVAGGVVAGSGVAGVAGAGTAVVGEAVFVVFAVVSGWTGAGGN
ncbi:hypothetical protein ACIBCN_20010 [Nocardia sp. NPDC051052]|uniref:hypothetical protein n=1 Tax=Nocardia sp. NPDC051052 TaxID=3364322 RepID=UPI0037B11D73